MKLIPLTRGLFAKVDDADFESLSRWSWQAVHSRNSPHFYAARSSRKNGKPFQKLMHRVILGITDSKILCDHKNGDSLDNRRDNLRPATNSQNKFNVGRQRNNTSGYRGVTLHRQTGKWQAQIYYRGVRKHLGIHLTCEDASNAYLAAAKELHGEFFRPEMVGEQ